MIPCAKREACDEADGKFAAQVEVCSCVPLLVTKKTLQYRQTSTEVIKWGRQHCLQVGTWADPYGLLLRLCISVASDDVLFRDGHSDRCDVGLLSLFLTLEASDGVSSLAVSM